MVRSPLPYAIPSVIKKVTFRKTIDGAPANSYLDGELILDTSFFSLPIDTQRFIIAHEGGHIANQNSNEFQADQWGFNWYVSNGGSLKQLVASLSDVLSFKSPEHLQRTKAMLNRCLQYDLTVNKNKMVTSIYNNSQLNSIGGWTPLQNLQTRFENKQERKDEKAQAKADAKRLAAEAKLERARNGGGLSGAVDKYGNMLSDVAGNIFGGGGGATQTDGGNGKTTTIILVVVGVIVLGVAAYFLLRKK